MTINRDVWTRSTDLFARPRGPVKQDVWKVTASSLNEGHRLSQVFMNPLQEESTYQ